jgi:hypothetical protein
MSNREQASLTNETKQLWDTALNDFKGKTKKNDMLNTVLSHWLATKDNKNETTSPVLMELEKLVIAESTETGLPAETIVQGVFNTYTQGKNADTGTGKIAATVREIMAANVKAKEWHEKTAISASGIFKLTGCNQTTIRKWLKDNAEMVEAHHKAMGIENTTIHNRKVGQYRKSLEPVPGA